MTMTAHTTKHPTLPNSSNSTNSSSASSSSHVRVVARIRPLSQPEQKAGSKAQLSSLGSNTSSSSTKNRTTTTTTSTATTTTELVQVHGNRNRWFELDAVLDETSTQHDVYVRSGARQAVCDDLFRGYNATILAYGQTGSGKTHTMGTTAPAPAAVDSVGTAQANAALDEEDGMIPRACVDLFASVQHKCDGNAVVEMTFLEIYNEQVRDLLVDTTKTTPAPALKIRESLHGEVYVAGLLAVSVSSPAEVGRFMAAASQRRVVASTAMNAVSSRSHAICTLTVTGMANHYDDDGEPEEGSPQQQFTAKLTLVDLAGSERIKKTAAAGNRRAEGISINKGLFVLGQVVSSLSSASDPSVDPTKRQKPPFRDSTLTRLLQNSLGGNSRTIMVACVSPAEYNLDESINTLRYATSARKIKSCATRNVVTAISPDQAAALQRENQLLHRQVAELQQAVRTLARPPPVLLQVDGDERSWSSSVSSASSTSVEEDTDCDGSVHVRVVTAGSTGGDDNPVARLEQQVAQLTKQLQMATASARATGDASAQAAIELPALKVEVELLRDTAVVAAQLEQENAELRERLAEAVDDAESARHAAGKLSEILQHVKELRRDEIDLKKQELKVIRKDEAWVLFMDTLLDSRADVLSSLVMDFDWFKSFVNGRGMSAAAPKTRGRWFISKGGSTEAVHVPEWTPEVREKMVEEQMEGFLDRMVDMQNDIKEELQSLREMRTSIERESRALQDEIGKDEVEEQDRLDRGENRKDMLEKLKQAWGLSKSSIPSS
jgi:hypothetical protein